VYTSNRDFDNAIQLANDIINMDTRTVFGSFDDTALLYAHKVLASCYRFGYATSINIDNAYNHYKMSLLETPLSLEQWLDDYQLQLLSVKTESVSINTLNNIPMGCIYTNSINKSLHNDSSRLVVIDIMMTLQSSTFMCTPILITTICSNKDIVYIADYNVLMSQYSSVGVDNLNKLVKSVSVIVDNVIDNVIDYL
jgi:hypothetical protein